MVSIELQRTHMSFDGLGDVFDALGAELVPGKVEGRQRPNGRSAISKGGTGDIYSGCSCTYLHSGIAAARALMPVVSDIQ